MNSSFRKYILYALGFLGLSTLIFIFWSSEKNPDTTQDEELEVGYQTISGKALGVDWQMVYRASSKSNLKNSLDSLLSSIENLAFTGNSTSEINRLNNLDTLPLPKPELVQLLQSAQQWTNSTDGAVDFTQSPLDRAWDFSSSGARLIDSTGVGYILQQMGIGRVILSDTLIKKPLGLKIDFSSVIQGYALAQVKSFLTQQVVTDYHLKLGNLELVSGQNEREELWKTEISYVGDSTGTIKKGIIALQNQALAKAGNTEQFYLKDSTRVSFTLDPRTGYPVNHGLLGVTLLSPDPLTSDLLSSMLMVKGTGEAIRLDSSRADIQMILIFSQKGGKIQQYISPELKKMLSFPVE